MARGDGTGCGCQEKEAVFRQIEAQSFPSQHPRRVILMGVLYHIAKGVPFELNTREPLLAVLSPANRGPAGVPGPVRPPGQSDKYSLKLIPGE
jgi:hypothetical protein